MKQIIYLKIKITLNAFRVVECIYVAPGTNIAGGSNVNWNGSHSPLNSRTVALIFKI